ncbi:hypothetical protein B0H11DRAFT_2188932 [Mycena galericulata]|nr:hypothetical protein B0H11DRAFT_2202293 [Mycena galericulata]KAJ7501294.1 hypothetical protein B0H11DRAFT_2188932 [Mycena galericulata]
MRIVDKRSHVGRHVSRRVARGEAGLVVGKRVMGDGYWGAFDDPSPSSIGTSLSSLTRHVTTKKGSGVRGCALKTRSIRVAGDGRSQRVNGWGVLSHTCLLPLLSRTRPPPFPMLLRPPPLHLRPRPPPSRPPTPAPISFAPAHTPAAAPAPPSFVAPAPALVAPAPAPTLGLPVSVVANAPNPPPALPPFDSSREARLGPVNWGKNISGESSTVIKAVLPAARSIMRNYRARRGPDPHTIIACFESADIASWFITAFNASHVVPYESVFASPNA